MAKMMWKPQLPSCPQPSFMLTEMFCEELMACHQQLQLLEEGSGRSPAHGAEGEPGCKGK